MLCLPACVLVQDDFQEQYSQTGRFPGPVVSPPRRPWALINWLFWSCLLLYPLGLLLSQLATSGSVATVLITVSVCCAGWFHTVTQSVSSGFLNQLLIALQLTIIFVID